MALLKTWIWILFLILCCCERGYSARQRNWKYAPGRLKNQMRRWKSPFPSSHKSSESLGSAEVQCLNDNISSPPTVCDKNLGYRSIDGSCNNLRYPTWGQAKTPFRRLLSPRYDADGKGKNNSGLRQKSIAGGHLPSTRAVSTAVHHLANESDLSVTISHMHMLWGQFLDHDISLTPQTPKVSCCSESGGHLADLPENCSPITIPDQDPTWSMTERTCMSFRRSKFVSAGECGQTVREQINDITAWLDGSMVYGSSDELAKSLRDFSGGRLRVGEGDNLPSREDGTTCDIPTGQPQNCFLAGDARVNVWAGLAGMHTAFVREHNRIADIFTSQLQQVPFTYSPEEIDEIAYQEARKVVAAEIQVITYNQYLPSTLGAETLRRYGLSLGDYNYSPDTDPTVANEFATAAFRFGHKEIPFGTNPANKGFHPGTFLSFEDMFNQPEVLRSSGVDGIMRGLVVEPCSAGTTEFSKSVRDNLFTKSVGNLGLDLVAINNQRGRDHGIPSYNYYRQFCGLERADNFSTLADHSVVLQQALASVYAHVDDIDLFTGGVTERSSEDGSMVGPTFSCILGEQFQRLKEGDRFWFENIKHHTNPFSADQVEQLKHVTLSKILCNNIDLSSVPSDVFRLDSAKVSCSHFPDIDFTNWLDYLHQE